MSVIAWAMIILAFLNVYLMFRSIASGRHNPALFQGGVIVTHIIGFAAQIALCGRVLTWW